MGLYDEVRVNGQTVQTKAFSRLLCRYEAGDKLDVHTWDDAPRVIDRHDSPTAAVAALDETGSSCWIILRGGVIDSITDHPPEGIARFDYRGRPETRERSSGHRFPCWEVGLFASFDTTGPQVRAGPLDERDDPSPLEGDQSQLRDRVLRPSADLPGS